MAKQITQYELLISCPGDIIDEVNISRGLLYYHFKNKEDILYCIIDRFSNPLLERLERLSFQGEGDAIDKVRAFINTTMIPEQNVTTESSVLQDAINLEENRYLLDRFYHKLSGRMTECFSHIIEQGNQEGVFHVAAPMETAAFLMTGYILSPMMPNLPVKPLNNSCALWMPTASCWKGR